MGNSNGIKSVEMNGNGMKINAGGNSIVMDHNGIKIKNNEDSIMMDNTGIKINGKSISNWKSVYNHRTEVIKISNGCIYEAEFENDVLTSVKETNCSQTYNDYIKSTR